MVAPGTAMDNRPFAEAILCAELGFVGTPKRARCADQARVLVGLWSV